MAGLIVGVNGMTGDGLDATFKAAGITYTRIDIGWSGSLQTGLA